MWLWYHVYIITKKMKRTINRILDMVGNSVNREHMRSLHVYFSEYMLPRLKYYRDHIDISDNVPGRYDDSGNLVGTMTREEWVKIIDDIVYAIEYDIERGRGFVVNVIPDDLNCVGDYLEQVRINDERCKRGFRLLGIYYGDLWG